MYKWHTRAKTRGNSRGKGEKIEENRIVFMGKFAFNLIEIVLYARKNFLSFLTGSEVENRDYYDRSCTSGIHEEIREEKERK